MPLLDEAAELLGDDDRAARDRREQHRRAEVAYAEGVLDIARGSRPVDTDGDPEPEELAADLVDAAELARRQERRDTGTIAQQAAADRRWVFGHVIVDEAQELSPMAWRTLMRRCPGRSMTLVGDPAQAGDPAAAGSWEAALAPYVGQRWRWERLTVNYRTPVEVMAVAAGVLSAVDPALAPPRSVRHTGVAPWWQRVPAAELADRLPRIVTAELAELAEVTERAEPAEPGAGRLAVIVPGSQLPALGRAVTAAIPQAVAGSAPEALDSRVAVLAVRQAKGLEFDAVLVVEPARILAESSRGASDLYVALTRATRRLGIVHTGELPAALDRSRIGVPST